MEILNRTNKLLNLINYKNEIIYSWDTTPSKKVAFVKPYIVSAENRFNFYIPIQTGINTYECFNLPEEEDKENIYIVNQDVFNALVYRNDIVTPDFSERNKDIPNSFKRFLVHYVNR